jgi:hypothetical protein
MKLAKVIAIAMILAMALIVSSVAAAGGNGIDLKGQHYNLNLIGSKFVKNWEPTQDSNSHVIFVAMGKGERVSTQIYLQKAPEGESFDVIDGNGADGYALFQLPKPYVGDPDLNDSASECLSTYQIYVRVVAGKGSGNITTKACNDTATGDGICTMADGTTWVHSDGVVDLEKNRKFQQVTHELTTVMIEGTHYGLFSEKALELYGVDTYFWELMNDGLKNIQIRFYPTPPGYCETT